MFGGRVRPTPLKQGAPSSDGPATRAVAGDDPAVIAAALARFEREQAAWSRYARIARLCPPFAVLPSVTQQVTEGDPDMDGFDPGDCMLPGPQIPVHESTRDRLVRVAAAMVAGATPEEITGMLDEGFPPEVDEALERPGELAEMRAHVDLLLHVMQTPAAAAAA